MFERFTDRARRVLVLAQEEARKLGHGYIGTEHLLLALIEEGEGVAAKALRELGFEPDKLRARVFGAIGPGGEQAMAAPPFTPRSKNVLEFSLREALSLGHNYIGTEHLLLGLIREGEGIGAQVLVAAGVQLDDVRAKVIELLRGYVGAQQTRPPGFAGHVTPAASVVEERARAEAGVAPLGSQHLLLAILKDEDSLGARLLQSFGVTEEAVRQRIDSMGIVGTSDEVPPPPPPAGPRPEPPLFELALDNGLTLRVHDEAMAAQFRAAVVAGVSADPPRDIANVVRDALLDILKPKEQEPPT